MNYQTSYAMNAQTYKWTSLSLKPNPLQVVGRVTLDQATGILLSLVPITLPAHRKDEHLAWIREVVFNGILEWAKQ